jgi:hypothetical protein
MKVRSDRRVGPLGILLCVAGFVLIFVGWNGAAGVDRVPEQIPFLISGGIAGLALVVVGAALLVADRARADRVALQAALEELRGGLGGFAGAAPVSGAGVTEGGGAPTVLAASSSYHRDSCRLIEGQSGLRPMTVEAAQAAGLEACRICNPA